MRKALLLGTACLLAVGCGSPSGGEAAKSGEAAHRKLRIAVIPKGTLHDFWKSIHAGAVKAERELDGVEVLWKGPAREDDREAQIRLVENFVSRGVDAIVLAPTDRVALVKPVEAAERKGIPVVVIDSGLETSKIASYIATDNYNGGVIAARHMGKILQGKGNVVVLRYQTGSASTEQREAGFLDTLKREFPDIVLLSDNLQAGATREGAIAKAENLLTQFGSKIDGWFCPCEPVTFGTIRAMSNRGVAGKIKVVGFDAGDAVVEALRNGEIAALVLQDPVRMGYLGVKTAVQKLRGEEIAEKISTGETLVTRENMDEPKFKALHSPDLKEYLGE